jgi:hypothetical protein
MFKYRTIIDDYWTSVLVKLNSLLPFRIGLMALVSQPHKLE